MTTDFGHQGERKNCTCSDVDDTDNRNTEIVIVELRSDLCERNGAVPVTAVSLSFRDDY